MLYLSVGFDFVGVFFQWFSFFFFYFYANKYFENQKQRDDYKWYLVKEELVNLPIIIMILYKLYFGLKWVCFKSKNTRNNFIKYYRIGVTTNTSQIFIQIVVTIVMYELGWIMISSSIFLLIYCICQNYLLHFYLQYLDAIHVAKNNYSRD